MSKSGLPKARLKQLIAVLESLGLSKTQYIIKRASKNEMILINGVARVFYSPVSPSDKRRGDLNLRRDKTQLTRGNSMKKHSFIIGAVFLGITAQAKAAYTLGDQCDYISSPSAYPEGYHGAVKWIFNSYSLPLNQDRIFVAAERGFYPPQQAVFTVNGVRVQFTRTWINQEQDGAAYAPSYDRGAGYFRQQLKTKNYLRITMFNGSPMTIITAGFMAGMNKLAKCGVI